MKRAILAMPILLSACLGADASFKDVQRHPPVVTDPAYLVTHERPLAEWIAETSKKCAKFGCVDG